MADTIITFTIPSEKVSRVINSMKGVYPIPTTTDEGIITNDFTDSQWAKEATRRFVVRTVQRYESKVAKTNAEIEMDNEVIE